MMNKKVDKKVTENNQVDTFSKVSILSSNRFADKRDLLSVLLQDNKEYSIKEVNDLIDNYMKGKVN